MSASVVDAARLLAEVGKLEERLREHGEARIAMPASEFDWLCATVRALRRFGPRLDSGFSCDYRYGLLLSLRAAGEKYGACGSCGKKTALAQNLASMLHEIARHIRSTLEQSQRPDGGFYERNKVVVGRRALLMLRDLSVSGRNQGLIAGSLAIAPCEGGRA